MLRERIVLSRAPGPEIGVTTSLLNNVPLEDLFLIAVANRKIAGPLELVLLIVCHVNVDMSTEAKRARAPEVIIRCILVLEEEGAFFAFEVKPDLARPKL